jgi:hypothetical protein
VGGAVQLDPLGTAATNRPIVPAPGDYDDGEIGGMIGKGNRSTRRKPSLVPLCPPQTPHAARTRTRAAAVGSQRLTAWATTQPYSTLSWFRSYLNPVHNLTPCFSRFVLILSVYYKAESRDLSLPLSFQTRYAKYLFINIVKKILFETFLDRNACIWRNRINTLRAVIYTVGAM